MDPVTVIGAGLAGSEAAWQIAQRGVPVRLFEMRPGRMTAAHHTGSFAELVCSNSLGSDLRDRAMGIIKTELRRLNSLIIACAERTAVPAGGALAVGREEFSDLVTATVCGHPLVEVHRGEVTEVPLAGMTVVATGPLTSQALAGSIEALAGQHYLYFFDAMAPIVTLDSVNMEVCYRANRRETETVGDYINCPFTREEYYAFVEALRGAEKIDFHEFEQDEAARRYFEACLPVEVLAGRSPDALAFGPMRAVGLRDPRTGHRPHAVIQLRQDNVAGDLYNLVGFQTNLKWTDQERVLRMIPGLADAEFVRFGQMHRNTFINSPSLLRPTLQWHDRETLFFAGQITGTEGYVGSAAGGMWAGINAARLMRGEEAATLPATTMMGALFHYVTHAEAKEFQPMKANIGLLPPLDAEVRGKRERAGAHAERALVDLERTLEEQGIEAAPPPSSPA